jgi:hypothetical protein
VNYLPTRLSLLGEQAPPPINPRLQTCIEETVFVRFQTDGDNIKSAINKARGIDVSVLPERLGKQFGDSLGKAESTFQLLDDIKTAETAMNEAVPGYSPLHVKVREIERDIRRYEAEMKLAETQLRRVRGDDEAAQQLRSRLEKPDRGRDRGDREAEGRDPVELDGRPRGLQEAAGCGQACAV